MLTALALAASLFAGHATPHAAVDASACYAQESAALSEPVTARVRRELKDASAGEAAALLWASLPPRLQDAARTAALRTEQQVDRILAIGMSNPGIAHAIEDVYPLALLDALASVCTGDEELRKKSATRVLIPWLSHHAKALRLHGDTPPGAPRTADELAALGIRPRGNFNNYTLLFTIHAARREVGIQENIHLFQEW